MRTISFRNVLGSTIVASIGVLAGCAATASVDGQTDEQMREVADAMEKKNPVAARQIRCIADSDVVAKIHIDGGGFSVEATGHENQLAVEACAGSARGARGRSASAISSSDVQEAYNPRYIACMKVAGYTVIQRSDQGLTNEDGSVTLTLHDEFTENERSRAAETRCSASAMSAVENAPG